MSTSMPVGRLTVLIIDILIKAFCVDDGVDCLRNVAQNEFIKTFI